ncbi:hypothetical protein BC332_33710 [Capsicum chinense]|nr:hypothetical protein BC332_33710 [Capsicum chinense]
MKSNTVVITNKLENIFPPVFFDVMEHLPIHLVREARIGGSVQTRWMYPFERDKSDWWAIIKIKPIGRVEVENVLETAYQNKMQIDHQLVDVDCLGRMLELDKLRENAFVRTSTATGPVDKRMVSLGYRFHPTDEELINYLKNFVLHGVLPPRDFIKVADLFEDLEPWEIMAGSEEKTRYFLSRLKRFKNSTKKFSRTVGKGTWKGQNSGNPIEDGLKKNTTIGYKRSLKYKSDNEKDENNDKWLMKEYFLPDEYFMKSNKNYAFIICKIKEKKKNEKKNKGVVNDDVMEEEVDEFIDYVLESIPDNHQVITNGDDNRFAVANEVNYEVMRTNYEASTSTLHEDYGGEGRSNYLEGDGVEDFNGINHLLLGVEDINDENCCIDYDELLEIIG